MNSKFSPLARTGSSFLGLTVLTLVFSLSCGIPNASAFLGVGDVVTDPVADAQDTAIDTETTAIAGTSAGTAGSTAATAISTAASATSLAAINIEIGAMLPLVESTRQHTKMVAALQQLQARTALKLNEIQAIRDNGRLVIEDPDGQTWSLTTTGWNIDSQGNVDPHSNGAGMCPGAWKSPRYGVAIDLLSIPGSQTYLTPQQTTALIPVALNAAQKLGSQGASYLNYGVGTPISFAPFYGSRAPGSGLISFGVSGSFDGISGNYSGSYTPGALGSGKYLSLSSYVHAGQSPCAIPLAGGAYLTPLSDSKGQLDGAYVFCEVNHPSPENHLAFKFMLKANFPGQCYNPAVGLMPKGGMTLADVDDDPDALDNCLTNGLTFYFQINAPPKFKQLYSFFSQAMGWPNLLDFINNDIKKFVATNALLNKLDITNTTNRVQTPSLSSFSLIGMSVSTSTNSGGFSGSGSVNFNTGALGNTPIGSALSGTSLSAGASSSSGAVTASYNPNPQVTYAGDTYIIQQQQAAMQQSTNDYQAQINANPNGAVLRTPQLPSEQKQWTNARAAVEKRISQMEVTEAILLNRSHFNSNMYDMLTTALEQIDALKQQNGVSAEAPFIAGMPNSYGQALYNLYQYGTASTPGNTVSVPNPLPNYPTPTSSSFTGGVNGVQDLAATGYMQAFVGDVETQLNPNTAPSGAGAIPQLAQVELEIQHFIFELQKDNREITRDVNDIEQKIHEELLKLDDVYTAVYNQSQQRMRNATDEINSLEFASTPTTSTSSNVAY